MRQPIARARGQVGPSIDVEYASRSQNPQLTAVARLLEPAGTRAGKEETA